MSSLVFQELDNDPAEFRGLFEIHQMARVTGHHTAGSRYTCLDGSCMRMNIWNVSIPHEQQGWDVNLSQPRQCWLHWELQLRMCEVLRIGSKNVSHSLLRGIIS